jgi:hypothetical protein
MHDKASVVLPDWMKFPTLAQAFEPTPEKTVAALKGKEKEYLIIEAAGAPSEKVRARIIARCYARTSELLMELETARNEINGKQQAGSGDPRHQGI